MYGLLPYELAIAYWRQSGPRMRRFSNSNSSIETAWTFGCRAEKQTLTRVLLRSRLEISTYLLGTCTEYSNFSKMAGHAKRGRGWSRHAKAGGAQSMCSPRTDKNAIDGQNLLEWETRRERIDVGGDGLVLDWHTTPYYGVDSTYVVLRVVFVKI
jgi:hypothetical protein